MCIWVFPKYNDTQAQAATWLRIGGPMSYILKDEINIAETDLIAPGISNYAVITHMDMYSSLAVVPELWSNSSKCCSFAMNKQAKSPIVTEVLNIS